VSLKGLLPAVLTALVLAGVAVGAATVVAVPPGISGDGTQWRVRGRDVIYRFDAAFRIESLFLATDRYEAKDLSLERGADLIALRARLLSRLGVASLDDVPREAGEHVRELQRLGYFGTDPSPR
jgi:hypothetical protein